MSFAGDCSEKVKRFFPLLSSLQHWCCVRLTMAVLYFLTAGAIAGENSFPVSTVGILHESHDVTVTKVSDLISVILSKKEAVQLVERDKLDKVFKEKSLTAALTSPQKRLQLGQTIGADFLVFLDRKGAEQQIEEIRLRAVDCQTGAIVYETVLPFHKEKAPESLLQKASHILLQKMKWRSKVSRDELVPVSIPTINCLAPDAVSDRQLARRIRRRLRTRLGSRPEIICLERQEIKKAKREIEGFKGKAADFWNSSVIVIGTAGLQGENLRELFVSLKLRFPDGKEQKLESVTGKSRELDKIMKTTAEGLVEQLLSDDRSSEVTAFERNAEVEYLSQLARIYYSKSQFRKAQKMMEAVFALQEHPTTKKQCFLMAGILQNLLPNHRSSIKPEKKEVYYARLERYIYMFEHFILPKKWCGNVHKQQPVRRDIGGFLMLSYDPETEEMTTSFEDGELDDAQKPRQRRFQRIQCLRQLWREYDLKRNRIGMRRNFCAYWRDFDKVCAWYKNHWETVVDQVLQPANSNDEMPEDGTMFFDTDVRKRFKKRGYGDPLSNESSDRGIFVFEICRKYMWVMPPDRQSSEMPAKFHKLYQVHYEATVELCNRLSLSSFTKAALLVYLRGPRDLSHSQWWISARINLPDEKFQKSVKLVIQILRNYAKKGDSHWIIARVLSDTNSQHKDRRRELAKIFWKALHNLPPEDRKETFENLFYPLMSKHPESHFASCFSSSLIWFDEQLGMPKTLDKTVLTESEQWLLTQLLTFYRQAQKGQGLFTDPGQIQTLNRVMNNTEAVYPELAREVKRRIQKNTDEPTEDISLPMVFPQAMLPEDHPPVFGNFKTPINWTSHGDCLWILWGGESGYLLTAINVKKLSVEKAVPVYLRHNFGNPPYDASVSWAFSSKRVLVGIRDYRERVRGIHPFATDSVETSLKTQEVRDSLSELIEQAEPAQNYSGRIPVPKRAAKNITAFCALNSNVYFANQHGIYCWNERTNELKLLASNQLNNNNSPLNGGMAYIVRWMEADPEHNRIVLGVREIKIGRSYKLRDRLGPRSGIWTYHADNKSWEQVRQMAFGSLPGRVETKCKNGYLFFTRYFGGSSVSGTMNLQTGNLHYRGDDSIAVGDGEEQGGWRWTSPLGEIDFPQNVDKYIYHLAKEAWIVYGPGEGNQMYWVENGEIVQTLTLKNLHVRSKTGELMVKVIPVPEGALIWHLRETEGEKLVPAFLHWKVDSEPDRKNITIDLQRGKFQSHKEASATYNDAAKGDFAEEKISVLVEALKKGKPEVRKCAAQELGEREDARAIQPLIEALESFCWSVRAKAVKALGQIGDSDAVPALMERLKDPYWRVRETSAQALGKIGDPAAIPALQRALDDPNGRVCGSAAWGLAGIEKRRSLSLLLEALHHENEEVRKTAAYAIPVLAKNLPDNLAYKLAMPNLIDTLTDESSKVRRAVTNSLRRITKQNFGQDADKWKEWWRENRKTNK